MPISNAIKPTAKAPLPNQSILAGLRTPLSFKLITPHTVPSTPTGTETQNTSRQSMGPRIPPSTRPMNDPAIAATMLVPSANPRWLGGKASVRMAAVLAMMKAPPTPCINRMTIMNNAADAPCSHVTDNRMENKVKIAKPMLYIRTRPTMSPSRPKLTTRTAVTSM